MYTYHRQGLDIFLEKPEEARKNILEILKSIRTVNRALPNAILKIAFFDAKADEIASIYKEGNIAVRREAYNLLVEIDPSETEKYRSIIEN
jgi:hypothetical protein